MSSPTEFDLETFERCLDVYGADWERWPEQRRTQGRLLLATSEAAERLWQEALELERALALAPTLEPSAQLLRSVLEIPLREERRRVIPARKPARSFPVGRTSVWAFAAAAVAALGWITGSLTGAGSPGGDVSASSRAPAAAVEEGARDELGWTEQEAEELSELAFALHLEQASAEEWP
jgi:hypothetical protein